MSDSGNTPGGISTAPGSPSAAPVSEISGLAPAAGVGHDPTHTHSKGTFGHLVDPDLLLSPRERVLADGLVQEGHTVEAVPPSDVRRPDAVVCGEEVEFKSLEPGASAATLKNAVSRARGQATTVIVDARGSGLAAAQVDPAVKAYLGSPHAKLSSLRVLGEGYDITYDRGRIKDMTNEIKARRPETELSL